MYHFWTQNTFTVSCPMARGEGGEGVFGLIIFAGYMYVHVCVWPLRNPTPLKSILWPIDVPILSIFEDPILVTFCLCIYLIQPFN